MAAECAGNWRGFRSDPPLIVSRSCTNAGRIITRLRVSSVISSGTRSPILSSVYVKASIELCESVDSHEPDLEWIKTEGLGSKT